MSTPTKKILFSRHAILRLEEHGVKSGPLLEQKIKSGHRQKGKDDATKRIFASDGRLLDRPYDKTADHSSVIIAVTKESKNRIFVITVYKCKQILKDSLQSRVRGGGKSLGPKRPVDKSQTNRHGRRAFNRELRIAA